jgi:hypothetical protein
MSLDELIDCRQKVTTGHCLSDLVHWVLRDVLNKEITIDATEVLLEVGALWVCVEHESEASCGFKVM